MAAPSPDAASKASSDIQHVLLDLDRPDKGIDRHTCVRTVPMEVLNLSMSRCGTSCEPPSMKVALEILGYRDSYHWWEIYTNIQDCDMWSAAFDAKYKSKGKSFGRAEFDKLLGHCSAVNDAPANCFAKELVEAYPEAKVILVERDEDAWYRSFKAGIIDQSFRNPLLAILPYFDPAFTGRMFKMSWKWISYDFGVTTKEGMEACAREHYRKHNANVKALVPKENLLLYELGSGWGPLCQFLGKPVPDVPYPALNEGAALAKTMEIVRRRFVSNVGNNRLRYVLLPLLFILASMWQNRGR